MLVLPNMDPSLHTNRSYHLPRTALRQLARATTHLSLLFLKITGVAVAMLLLPRTIQMGVQCVDEMYETLGRRARSPWETKTGGFGVIWGVILLFVLHGALWRVSYGCVLDERGRGVQEDGSDGQKYRGVTWERVLVRVVVPVLLYGGLCSMIWTLWGGSGRDFVVANTVDLIDDAGAGLMWRNR
jgi:hypothetical protein